MTELERIEAKIGRLLGGLSLRPTLKTVSKVGGLLIRAKSLVRHGEWYACLARLKLRPRAAQVWMQVARQQDGDSDEVLTLTDFLHIMRQARVSSLRSAEEEERRQLAAVGAALPDDKTYRLVAADCRRYRWPAQVDLVATDPPWEDMDAYRWLGRFAARRLRPGGLLLAQCGQSQLLGVGNILSKAGLDYRWTLAIVYPTASCSPMVRCWGACWRPVLVLSRGTMDLSGVQVHSDTYTVKSGGGKPHHKWEQPVEPWRHWLARLTRAGDLVADPFCGSGTIAVALKQIGGRRYLGTDKEADNIKIARGRLAREG
jgi:hypothetical protein